MSAKTKAKTVVAERVFTEEELDAAGRILAERSKANRDDAGKPGLRPVKCMPSDSANNVLARCQFNTEGERPLFGVALQVKKDGRIVRRLGISASRGWTPGFSVDDGEDGDLSALAALIAENAPEIEAHLSSVYAKAAKKHTFVEKEKKAAE